MGYALPIAALVFLASWDVAAQPTPVKDLPKFMGHAVTMIKPELDADGFPKDAYPRLTVCVEFVPQRQCHTAPDGYLNNPMVSVVQVRKDISALFFSAETYGGSGYEIRFELLRPGPGKDLQEIFLSDTSVPNQSQYAFWIDPSISDAQIFVTAGYVWGPDEAHYDKHRYIISAYVLKPNSVVNDTDYYYYLEDRYMTIPKYDLDANANILGSEKQEILARLRRIKAASERKPQPPH
jgi:hypothetical protein